MRRTSLVAGLVPALVTVLPAAAVSLATTNAFAGPHLDADLDFGTALQNRTGQTAVDFSLGGGLRLGYRFGIPGSIVYIQPEIGGSYAKFGFNSGLIGYDYAGVLKGGLKLGLSGIVQPNIFGHVGLGIMGYNTDCTAGGCGTETGYLGPEADIGAGLDFRIVPGFTLGAQVAYNSVLVPEVDSAATNQGVYGAAKWVSFGLTAGFHIGEPAPRRYYGPVYYRRY